MAEASSCSSQDPALSSSSSSSSSWWSWSWSWSWKTAAISPVTCCSLFYGRKQKAKDLRIWDSFLLEPLSLSLCLRRELDSSLRQELDPRDRIRSGAEQCVAFSQTRDPDLVAGSDDGSWCKRWDPLHQPIILFWIFTECLFINPD